MRHVSLDPRPDLCPSPAKVSKGLFNAGVGLVMLSAVSDAAKMRRFLQLEQCTAADRGRTVVAMIAKWSFELRRSKHKENVARNLLENAGNASSAIKASVSARLIMIRNPASVCRELATVVKTLVEALDDTGMPAARGVSASVIEDESLLAGGRSKAIYRGSTRLQPDDQGGDGGMKADLTKSNELLSKLKTLIANEEKICEQLAVQRKERLGKVR